MVAGTRVCVLGLRVVYAEDGILEDDEVRWSSDLLSDLGADRHLAVTGLLTCTHSIALRAADSDCQSATATTMIYVDVPLQYIMLPLVMKP